MGYYLDMTAKTLGKREVYECCIGGKFFGYLDDDEFEKCQSVKYLTSVSYYDKVELELLNVWWSNYSFMLKKPEAVKFLQYYSEDVAQFKSVDFVDSVTAAIEAIKPLPDDTEIYFEMG